MARPPERFFAVDKELPPALPATIVDVPLLVDLNAAVDLLEGGLPRTIGNIDKRQMIPGNKRASFAFRIRREPFRVTVKSDTFQIATTLHYEGRGWYDPPIAPEIGGSCGVDGPKPRARIAISIRPVIDRDWHLVAEPKLTYLGPLTQTDRDQCKVTFLRIDVTSKVLDAARGELRSQLPKLGAKLATLDVRGEIEKIWNEIQKPIKLVDSVWLMLRPDGIRLGKLSGSRQMMGATLGISAHPKIETGPEPTVATKALPNLDPATPATGLNILVEARFDYPLIGATLTNALKGTRIKAPGGVIEIEEIGAFGIGGGRLALGLRFEGTAAGQIYFVGTPQYDSAGGRITVPDLEYDASTSSLLIKGLAWLRATEIRDLLRAKATFPSAETLSRLADLAVKGMNRQLTKGVFLSASLNRTQVIGILPRPDALYLQARTDGQAALYVTDAFFAKFQPGVKESGDSAPPRR